jgi:two-component system capsular synthesis sensor histidine kinase RcsC
MSAVSKGGITSTFNPVSIGRAVRMAQDGIERPALGPAHVQRISLGLRVMVVEDNVISQIILREQLEHLGCTVAIVANGNEALRQWNALEHDVVLTDLNMPMMGGYELARSLRKLGYAGSILGLTASAAPEATRLGLDAGMDRVLLKPLPILVLAQALHDLAKDLN